VLAPLKKSFPLPLAKGKGIKGIGLMVDLYRLLYYSVIGSSKPGDRPSLWEGRKVRAPPGRMLGNAQEG